MNTYVWCEDTGSGYTFWKNIFRVMYEGFTVDSQEGNSRLCKFVARIEDDGNRHYVIMDHSIDNPEVLREIQRLHTAIKGKNNIRVIEVQSFEFVLLSFRLLEDWVFAEEDELKEKRSNLLEAKDLFVQIMTSGGDASSLKSFKELFDIPTARNSEQISSSLLYEITRNTGFETGKGTLGDCFAVDCCDWKSREDDDVCGLDDRRISADEKFRSVFEYSVLKDSFAKAGL